ncbi:expressed unknown protein [Seminavis robusta]|uniref:Uncharacterized protein n=1 Tax=Seminavis robusta TaxID=568900 RepID=A0A9N8EJD8_9STRA|nr:expressed unknown protein [Seminavis robusta]|eukprot:Sro1027_g233060.1 n/a (523) ;mRNA; f:17804-19568
MMKVKAAAVSPTTRTNAGNELLDTPGVYCNPSNSFDRTGSLFNLSELGQLSPREIDARIIDVNEDEEQGFEAVLDPSRFAKFQDISLTASSHTQEDDNVTLYGKEKLQRIVDDEKINSINKRDLVFKLLETMSIKTFIVVSGSEDNTAELLQRVRDVIDFIAILRRTRAKRTLKCCILFQDFDGLLYNLVLPTEAIGTHQTWHSNMNEFSGVVAVSALSVLSRVCPCLIAGQMGSVQPAYWGFMLALLVSEEMSLSFLNSSLLIQGMPSISSYVMINGEGYDWIHKLPIACFVAAGAVQGSLQRAFGIIGVSLTFVAILANLGSRAWHFLQFRKVSFGGPLAPLFAYIISVLAGLCFPHMGGCRKIEEGDEVAAEAVLKSAFGACALFLLSDLDSIQRLLLGGTEKCDQTILNIAMGSWIGLTLLVNLFLATKLQLPSASKENHHDLVLTEDPRSPVGYRVPAFPEFLIDPIRAKKSISFLTLEQEMYFAVFVAMTMMGVIVSMAFTGWSKTAEEALIGILK